MPSLMEGMRSLYPVEDVRRLTYAQSPDADAVSVDVHGMKCWQAKQFINNIINLSNRPFHLTVIHGYNHGTAIKDMVRNHLDNKRIMDRAADQFNLGITYLDIA